MGMKIRRYKERIATDWILDAEMGDWCREYRPKMSYEECYIDAGV